MRRISAYQMQFSKVGGINIKLGNLIIILDLGGHMTVDI